MSKKILILCPHNAAKSVYAAAILKHKANENGLDLSISTGGTDPDDVVLPVVSMKLKSLGHEVETSPTVVSADELSAADVIINIGCDHDELPTTRALTDWSVPNFSDNQDAAFASLDRHVEELLSDL